MTLHLLYIYRDTICFTLVIYRDIYIDDTWKQIDQIAVVLMSIQYNQSCNTNK